MWLMSKGLWSTLGVYESVLVFQIDSILLHRDEIDSFLAMKVTVPFSH